MSVTHVDPLQALAAFLFWIVIALALGVLIGHVFRDPQHEPTVYDQERDTGARDELQPLRERRRSHARNGLGGGAA